MRRVYEIDRRYTGFGRAWEAAVQDMIQARLIRATVEVALFRLNIIIDGGPPLSNYTIPLDPMHFSAKLMFMVFVPIAVSVSAFVLFLSLPQFLLLRNFTPTSVPPSAATWSRVPASAFICNALLRTIGNGSD